MVTGGSDRAVRLWTRYVTTRPVATLLGHSATVLDVAIYRPAGQIFSYSRDAVSKAGYKISYITYFISYKNHIWDCFLTSKHIL